MTFLLYPYGKNWTCVICEKDYPADTPLMTCPDDGGHLHRITMAVGRTPTPEEKMPALRKVHDEE